MGNSNSCTNNQSLHNKVYLVADEDSTKLHVLDAFVDTANIIYSIDSVKLLLGSSSGRDAFYQFLKSEHATENLNFFEAVDAFRNSTNTNTSLSTTSSDLKTDIGNIIDKFLLPSSDEEVNVSSATKSLIVSMVKSATDNIRAEVYETIRNALEKAQQDILIIMALGAYPRFVKTKLYKDWKRNMEKSSLKTVTGGITTASIATTSLGLSVEAILDEEVGDLLKSGSWISNFMAATDNLPFCIAIASANKNRHGFPLIFVNKMFIKTTGYSYAEVIGQNCKFLQQKEKEIIDAEKEQRLALTEALRDAKPVKVVITNYRKNGEKFLNLLSMKPIADQSGNYRYVVSIQFEVNDTSSMNMLSIADSLTDLLPSESFSNDVNPDDL